VVSGEADGRTRTEADSHNDSEADSRWTRFRTQHNRLLWPSSLPACLQTAYEAPPERRFLTWSGRRGSNPRQPAWKAGTLPLSYSRLYIGSRGDFNTHISITFVCAAAVA
jgi:hypothetical protein